MKKLLMLALVALLALPTFSFALAEAEDTQLLVGAAVRDVSPTIENGMLPVMGIGRESGPLVDVIQPIHTRVIALESGSERALIVVTETGKGPLGNVFCAELSEHTGVPVDAIFYTTSHAHAAPELVFDESFTVEPVEGEEVDNTTLWARYVLAQMKDAADEALANLKPATTSIGYGESYININREFTYRLEDGTTYGELGSNLNGEADPTLIVIRFDDEEGNPIAFLINYPCHAVSMIANTYFDGASGVDSDFPGQISLIMEEEYEGAVAVWTSGAAGDLNPFISNQLMYPDPYTGEQKIVYSGEPLIREMLAGIQLADIREVLENMQPVDTSFIAYADGSTYLPGAEGNDDVEMTLQLLRIGDLALIGNPGELFNSIGQYIQDNSPLEHTIIFNNTWNKGEPGMQLFYFPDDHAIENPGFAGTGGYQTGVINPMLSDLANELIAQTEG